MKKAKILGVKGKIIIAMEIVRWGQNSLNSKSYLKMKKRWINAAINVVKDE